jgi:indoleamine 2,3-dioxygenase
MTQQTRPTFPGHQFDDGVFSIGRERGFLPRADPPDRLPEAFAPAQDIIDALPVWLDVEAGERGLLGTPGAIVAPIEALPDLHEHVVALDPSAPDDAMTLALVFRAYTFLTSAYLLEPAHHAQRDGDGEYGAARRRLPAQLARPLVAAADALGVAPWLDYHYAYSLCNYVKKDASLTGEDALHWSNLGMACRFSGMPDEAGFIMLHVHINAYSGGLVGSISDAIAAAADLDADADDADALARLRDALRENLETMRSINKVRRLMWKASRPERYNDFRVFIMGIKGNDGLFGDGVVYEGVERFGEEPQAFRGQTGAQDDIIPTADIFSGVTDYYPTNKLTEYLMDLRSYRPVVVQRFFEELQSHTASSHLHAHMKRDPESAALLAGVVSEIYQFRNGHWQFVQRYILEQTRYQRATGGTPITTWLPNQIMSCLDYMGDLLDLVSDHVDALEPATRAVFEEVASKQATRRQILEDQMEELRKAAYDAARVFEMNKDQLDDPSAKTA